MVANLLALVVQFLMGLGKVAACVSATVERIILSECRDASDSSPV